ncbi:MAG: hypothetical protein JRH08_10885 [Deltaproteobacteria bacterium]|nr:hypothetical protein [Deltaproteobacteria bacterium]MBW1929281.1 hypothetical protein [Deltaproteobacteria bacterium]MBW2024758.1 hypothetical protein [Deltaproteobacteria bacterium]MBW2126183.1 hypothetical protein [Deltaproteobacteria bacterium]
MRASTAKKKKDPSPKELTLRRLEERVAQKGIQIHYDKLETAGLKLKGGLCKIKGEIHLFIDRRKSIEEKIGILTDCLRGPLPELSKSTTNDL